ncbi:MAG: ABC transporter substrate-binding protein [Rhodothermaceae bacterium]|nr:ABC transporter substrate-binding protein [Rhodothermaceae bacterium]
MRSRFLLESVLLALLGGACACQSPPDTTDVAEEAPIPLTIDVTDALGRTVTVPMRPSRVLSLAPNLTELVYGVGAGDRLAGASQADDFPPAVDSLPRFSTFPLEPEGLVVLQPDLLLATDEINSPTDADRLADLGMPTYFFTFATVADVPAAMRTLGDLMGTDAMPAAQAFEARVEAVQSRVAGAARPRTLLIIGDDVLYAFGEASYASEAVRIAGGENLTDAFEGRAATLSDEWVLQAAPETIVVLAGDDYDPAQLLERHPTWRLLPAVQNSRVVGLNPDWLSRPGPRLVDGIEALAAVLHPDRVPPA